jgi:hypothetical protein
MRFLCTRYGAPALIDRKRDDVRLYSARHGAYELRP